MSLSKAERRAELLAECSQVPGAYERLRTTSLKLLAELERLEGEAKYWQDRAAASNMLAYKWMERHDNIAAGVDPVTLPFPKPEDLPEAIKRAEAAEAELVRAGDLLRQQTCSIASCGHSDCDVIRAELEHLAERRRP